MEVILETKGTKVELTDRFKKEFSDKYNAAMKAVKAKKGKKKKGGMKKKK